MKKLSIALVLSLLLSMFAVSASAANFVASVQQKAAPEIVAYTTASGETVSDQYGNAAGALIRDQNGDTVAGVATSDIVVTPVSSNDSAVQARLSAAYDQIENADSLRALLPEIDAILEDLGFEGTADDLVVQELFDLSATDEVKEYLEEDGNTLTVRMDADLDPDEFAVVLQNTEDDNWEYVEATINADGTVDASFDSLAPVAIAVDNYDVEVSPDAPTSPQTGTDLPVGWILVAVLAGVLLVGAFVVRKRHAAN
jgi:uncharacterized protein (DUF1330 family)